MLEKLEGIVRKTAQNKHRAQVVLILVVVVLILAVILVLRLSGSKAFRADSKVTAFDLKDIGELATQGGFFTVVNVIDDSQRIGSWSIPFTASKYIFSYDGVIKAGMDFGEINWDADESSKTVTVQLPEAKILSNILKEDSLKIYDERQSIFTPLTLSDIQASRQEMLAELEQTATENGLLEQAGENAKTLIKGFLSGAYNPNEYSYVFE